jgi:predicted aldo/keto reductase-like oxidoreductase
MSRRDSTLHPGMLAMLEKLKKAGKTRFIGTSTHRNEPETIRAAIEARIYDVILTSYNFKQAHHEEVRKAIIEAARAGLGVIAMKTQAGVFWDKAKQHPIDMKAALRWAIRVPEVHTAIPGFTTADQLALDLEVLRTPTLTDADRKALERPTGVAAGFYCQGCETCRGQCREQLAIPDLMRGYMYAHAYRNRDAARELLDELGVASAACGSCAACTVQCPHGLDVRDRVRDVARLRDVPREFLV